MHVHCCCLLAWGRQHAVADCFRNAARVQGPHQAADPVNLLQYPTNRTVCKTAQASGGHTSALTRQTLSHLTESHTMLGGLRQPQPPSHLATPQANSILATQLQMALGNRRATLEEGRMRWKPTGCLQGHKPWLTQRCGALHLPQTCSKGPTHLPLPECISHPAVHGRGQRRT